MVVGGFLQVHEAASSRRDGDGGVVRLFCGFLAMDQSYLFLSRSEVLESTQWE